MNKTHNPPKKHHYLPKFYLKEFTDQDGKLSIFDRKTNTILPPQKPENCAVIGNLYTQIDERGQKDYRLESALSKIESLASPIIKELIAEKNISPAKRGSFVHFCALLFHRTPNHMRFIESLMREEHRKIIQSNPMKKIYKNLPGAPSDEKTVNEHMQYLSNHGKFKFNETEIMKLSLLSAAETAHRIVNRNWLVLHIDNQKQSFVTSDVPITLSSLSNTIGLARLDTFIIFPLTKSHLLIMYGEKTKTRHIYASRLLNKNIGFDAMKIIREINLKCANNSLRFLIGRNNFLIKSLSNNLSQKEWASQTNLLDIEGKNNLIISHITYKPTLCDHYLEKLIQHFG